MAKYLMFLQTLISIQTMQRAPISQYHHHHHHLLLLLLLLLLILCVCVWNQNNIILGSVWIELILLKLKTENWKHCSKIIFKYMNSNMGPNFNEKITQKWDLWVRYTVHGTTKLIKKSWKVNNCRLLFIWTVAVVP